MWLIWNVKIKHILRPITQTYELVCKKEDCLKAELPVAKVEEILKTWSKELHHHRIVFALCPVIPYQWYANTALHDLKENSIVIRKGFI